MVDFLQTLIRQQFDALTEHVRFVFIQPSFNSQHALLSFFLHEPHCLYVRLQGISSKDELQHALESARTSAPIIWDWPEIHTLILDEVDQIEADVLENHLISYLSLPRPRVLLLGRVVPHFVLTNPSLRPHLRVLPDEPSLMFLNYTLERSNTVLLEVRALGQGRVLVNGKPITDWDGELPRDLFFYLVDKGMTTRAQIFETFWPDLPIPEATNVFHVTKRKINEVLGSDLTEYTGGFYRLAPNIELSYDAALFTELIQRSAVERPHVAKQLLLGAIWLYKGDFLSSIHASNIIWVQHRRNELSQQYSEALMASAKFIAADGDKNTALGLYIRAARYNRQREDLAGVIMNLYRDLGLHPDALATYDRIEQELGETLGISPAQWLQDLAANIRAQHKQITTSISK